MCENCEEEYHRDYVTTVYDENGYERTVCNDCRDDNYIECEDCGEYHHENSICHAYDKDGKKHNVCENCFDTNYTECEECGKRYENDCIVDGLCPICHKYHENDIEESNEVA